MECIICFKEKSIVMLTSHFTLCQSFCELLSLNEADYLSDLIGLSFCVGCYEKLERVSVVIQELSRFREEIQGLLLKNESQMEYDVDVKKEISHILLRDKIVADLSSRIITEPETEVIIPDSEYAYETSFDTNDTNETNDQYPEFNEQNEHIDIKTEVTGCEEEEEPCVIFINEIKQKIKIEEQAPEPRLLRRQPKRIHSDETSITSTASKIVKSPIINDVKKQKIVDSYNVDKIDRSKIKSSFEQIVLGKIIIPKALETPNKEIRFRVESLCKTLPSTSKTYPPKKPPVTEAPVEPVPEKIPEFRIRKYVRRNPYNAPGRPKEKPKKVYNNNNRANK